MKKDLLTTLQYFGYFSYYPSLDEIFTFFPREIQKKRLQSLLTQHTLDKQIVRLPNKRCFRPLGLPIFDKKFSYKASVYTLPQYSTQRSKILNSKFEIFKKNTVPAIQTYIRLLTSCPFVRFVGVTGASAMWGWRKGDDLDLCIVTQKGLMWTTRLYVVLCAKILRLHNRNGVCLNLFFDGVNLSIPHKKQNIYIAHELIQMKPLVDKDGVYDRFFLANEWIYRLFPNGYRPAHKQWTFQKPGFISVFFERICRRIQLHIIQQNKTSFMITSTQLWLFKNDFEKKLKRGGIVI